MNKEDKILKLLEKMSNDIQGVKDEFQEFKSDIKEIDTKIEALESKLDEDYQISSVLLERTDIQSKTIEKIEIDIAKTQGRVIDIQKSIVDINNKANLALDNAAVNRLDLHDIKKTI
ncbi:hypothetical protein [Natronospora cellulosivora (SeqCode)]